MKTANGSCRPLPTPTGEGDIDFIGAIGRKLEEVGVCKLLVCNAEGLSLTSREGCIARVSEQPIEGCPLEELSFR